MTKPTACAASPCISGGGELGSGISVMKTFLVFAVSLALRCLDLDLVVFCPLPALKIVRVQLVTLHNVCSHEIFILLNKFYTSQ